MHDEITLHRGGPIVADVALAPMGDGLVAAWRRADEDVVRFATVSCRE